MRLRTGDAKKAGIDLEGFGDMGFGGPSHPFSGHRDEIRKSNDANFALARKHPEMLPVETVHPYDREAAIKGITRVAARKKAPLMRCLLIP